MKNIIFISAIILFISCGQNSQTNTTKDTHSADSVNMNDYLPVEHALKFINLYADNCNKMSEATEVVEWVDANDMTTQHFRTELKSIIDEARKPNSKTVLEGDPIFDAQDCPDKEFELDSFDKPTNYLVVRGKNFKDNKLTMKMVLENGNWLVDGSGIINIPEDQRMPR